MSAVVELFYMMIMADGHVDNKELEMGREMAKLEGFDISEFNNQVEELLSSEKDVYEQCLRGMKTLSREDQTRFLAWMCLIANADGFMHSDEWNLIYRIYHKELKLDRQSILDQQFLLKKELMGKSVHF
ncbi:MAG: TerB family tellurite resistance protein [Bacteroidota bacterium]